MKWSVKEYFLKAGICHLATNVCPTHFSGSWGLFIANPYSTRTWSQATALSSHTAISTRPSPHSGNTNCSWISSKPSNRVTRMPLLTGSSSTTNSVSWTNGRPPYCCGLRKTSKRPGKTFLKHLSNDKCVSRFFSLFYEVLGSDQEERLYFLLFLVLSMLDDMLVMPLCCS